MSLEKVTVDCRLSALAKQSSPNTTSAKTIIANHLTFIPLMLSHSVGIIWAQIVDLIEASAITIDHGNAWTGLDN
jgi:hypothetical protein